MRPGPPVRPPSQPPPLVGFERRDGVDAVRGEDLRPVPCDGGCRGRAAPAACRRAGHRDGIGQFEAGRGDQHDLLAFEGMGDQVGGHRQVGQPEIGALLPHRAHHPLPALAPHDVHPDAGVLGGVGGQQAPGEAGFAGLAWTRCEAPRPAGPPWWRALYLAPPRRGPPWPASPPGGPGRSPLPRRPERAKSVIPEFTFQVADRARKRRLCDIERPGGISHGAVLRSRDHITELLEIHAKNARAPARRRWGT